MQAKPGEIIAGKYRVERVLGEGGMGIVVEALHMQLDERVAIKFLLPQALGNEEAVARFAREARAAVKIKSEHVARVSDVGTLESGAPYMVMELLQGQDLAGLVHDSGPLAVADAVDYLLQASEAIAEAHALGIVHRDLKPANLFIIRRADGSPCIKVLDFGISKMTSTGGSGAELGMTRTHAIMGSPLYMSPEQLASTRDVDARADIWALGTILYELITGRVPFQADTMPQLCGMILHEPVPTPRSLRRDVPEALESAVLRCLEKDRGRRYQNLAELALALAPFAPSASLRSVERITRVLSVAGVPASNAALAPSSSIPVASSTQNGFGKTHPVPSKRGRWLVGALFVVAGVGGYASWLRFRSRAEEPPSAVLASSTTEPALPHASVSATAATIEPTPSALPSAFSAPAPSVSAPSTPAAAPRAAIAQPRRRAPNTLPSSTPPPVANPARPVEPPSSPLDPLQGRH
ncbi:MAG: serine/threonine protein kinase [Myxococcota bacterium]